jgi:hypothetical protein
MAITGRLTCDNEACRRSIDPVDYVTVVTTAHVRRFCDMYCVLVGFAVHEQVLHATAAATAAAISRVSDSDLVNTMADMARVWLDVQRDTP